MADFQNNFSLEDALTDNPPDTEPEIKRDFISSLEAEPFDDVVGETCGKSDYIPLLDDDAAKCGNQQKADGAERAASSQPPVLENGDRVTEEHFGKGSSKGAVDKEKMYSEFVAQKEPWQLEQELCFEPQPLFPPIKHPDPFEANRGDDLLSDLILLPSCDMNSRPAFTEHFGAAGDLPGFMAVPEAKFFRDPSPDMHVMGTAAVLSPHFPKSPTAPPNNATYEDDWLQVDHRHAEETEDLEDISQKTPGMPGEAVSERSPWEGVSYPVETVDDHTGTHWQPTILEQQELGMHHAAKPNRPAEFLLLEASVAAELAGAAEFADWQHAEAPVTEAAEIQDNKEPLIEFITFDDAAIPEEEGTVEKFCFPPKNSPEESEAETEEYDAAVVPGGPGDALEGLSSQQDLIKICEVISEHTELLEDLEGRPELFTCDAVAVPVTIEAADDEILPPQSSHKDSIPHIVVSDVTTLPVRTDDESLVQQNFHTDSHLEDLGCNAGIVESELSEELKQQESEHPKENHEAPSESMQLPESTENVPESVSCNAASSPVTHEATENESVLQQNINKEHLGFDPPVPSDADVIGEESASHKPPEVLSESSETLEHSESVAESVAYNEISVPLSHGKSDNGCVSQKDSNEVALRSGAVAQETVEKCLLANSDEPQQEPLKAPYIASERLDDQERLAESGSLAADLVTKEASEECLVTQSLNQESFQKDLGYDAPNLLLEMEEASGAHEDAFEERVPKSLDFDADLSPTTEERETAAVPIADHQQEHHAGETSAPTLAQDGGGLPKETDVNVSSFKTDTQEANPYVGQPSDPPMAPESDALMELKFEETRAPADGACAVEEEKHLADAGGHPKLLHSPAGEIFEELKANVSEAPAPNVFSPFEGQKPQAEAGELYRPEDFILDASVISQASPSIEAIAGNITTAPSKDLPPSPDKKVKASASAKPAAAKGRPTAVSSPKQSTPPPGKKAASPAPVASSTPKRPTSSSARTSTLTPRDSNTQKSSTLSPKEMKPKVLDLKSPVKSPEKKTPLSKPVTTPTARPTSKTPVGTPKTAMVPAVAVTSTTGSASKITSSTTPKRPTSIKSEAKPFEAKKTTTNMKSADPSRPRTAPANSGKSNATTPSSPGTNSAPGAPISRPKPSKPPGTKPIPESNAAGEKKLPAAKAPVSKANMAPKASRPVTVAAPDLKNVRSKIGSTDNMKHQPGGGRANIEKKTVPVGLPRKPAAPLPVTKTATTKTTVSKETAQKDTNGKVAKSVPASKTQPASAPKPRPGSTNIQIMNKKVDTSKVSSKCGSKANLKHKPGGGDVKIESHKSIPKDKVQAKVGSLDNMGHVPAGGKVKSEGSEEAGDLAQTPQNGDLSTPQSLAGSEMQQNGVPAEGSDQRETQNLDNQIQETN